MTVRKPLTPFIAMFALAAAALPLAGCGGETLQTQADRTGGAAAVAIAASDIAQDCFDISVSEATVANSTNDGSTVAKAERTITRATARLTGHISAFLAAVKAAPDFTTTSTTGEEQDGAAYLRDTYDTTCDSARAEMKAQGFAP